MTTTDLSKFGSRERKILIELLIAWRDQGLPEDFDTTDVVPMMNMHSGSVFLTNAEFQVAMLNGDTLESFYNSPYEGKEGFFEDMIKEYPNMHGQDQRWLRDIAKNIHKEEELPNED